MAKIMNQQLINIDFSNGIRAGAINENFNTIQDAIARERLAIAGSGISNGFDLKIDDFDIVVSEGSLIDNKGYELHVKEHTLTIPLPRTTQIKREVMTIDENGKLILPYIPYNPNRRQIARVEDSDNGIEVLDFTNASTNIKPTAINGNVLTFNNVSRKTVRVSYSYTDRRYDTVYINNDDEIVCMEGTTSGSPSFSRPEKENCKYILYFLEIDPFVAHEELIKVAKLKLKQDLRSIRTVFTDEYNNLFLCGEPFSDLQIIRMIEPKNPTHGTLWYDINNNLLKVWIIEDGLGRWVPVNNTAYVDVLHSYIWEPSENPLDRKKFIFPADQNQLRYTPNNNCLTIYINQAVVHSDQFDEITLADAKTNAKLKKELIEQYGYKEEEIENNDPIYDNIGIGFSFSEDHHLYDDCYVEARVMQRSNASPATRFERTAGFVATGRYRVGPSDKGIVGTTPYRYGENQLEVFLNGSRLLLNEDFYEGNEFDDPKQSAYCREFKLNENKISPDDLIEWKILTTVFSYDHVQKVLDDFVDEFEELKKVVADAIKEFKDAKDNFEERLYVAEEEIARLKNFHQEQLKASKKEVPTRVINQICTLKGQTMTIPNVTDKDWFNIYYDGRLLYRSDETSKGDYSILTSGDKTKVIFTDPTKYNKKDQFYITGYKEGGMK